MNQQDENRLPSFAKLTSSIPTTPSQQQTPPMTQQIPAPPTPSSASSQIHPPPPPPPQMSTPPPSISHKHTLSLPPPPPRPFAHSHSYSVSAIPHQPQQPSPPQMPQQPPQPQHPFHSIANDPEFLSNLPDLLETASHLYHTTSIGPTPDNLGILSKRLRSTADLLDYLRSKQPPKFHQRNISDSAIMHHPHQQPHPHPHLHPGMYSPPQPGHQMIVPGQQQPGMPMVGPIVQQQGKKKRNRDEVTVCRHCGTSETPEWRRGPDGARTLCNACGLYHAKMVKRNGPLVAAEILKKKQERAV